MKDNIKLTKKEKLEAYDKILGDDEDYINSFFNTDKFQTHIYNEKDGNKPFFKGYKPPYYFRNTTVEEDKAEQMVLERLSTPTGVNLFEEQKNLYIVNYKYKETNEEKYQRDTILIKAFDDKDVTSIWISLDKHLLIVDMI
jgi:hypothetical protein